MLSIGAVLLVFAGRVMKYGVIAVVGTISWYHRRQLPGYRKLPGLLDWIHFQLTATPRDREQRAENIRRAKEYQAVLKRQAELRERYKDVQYTQADIAAFFDKHSVQVACLVVVSDKASTVRSRIGGVPKLHSMSEWPRSGTGDRPLHFLAELHLSELPRLAETEPLPRDGVLMFFCDLSRDDWSSPRVVFQEGAGASSAVPDDLPCINEYLRKSTIRPQEPDLRLLPEFAVRPVHRAVLRPTSDLPEDVDWKLVNLASRHGETVFAEYVRQQQDIRLSCDHCNYHVIGGPASDVPNPTGGSGFKLLQLDSDPKLGLMIGDSGVLEFWIDPVDLATRRFENVRLLTASA